MKKALIVLLFALVSIFTFTTLFVGERDYYRNQIEMTGENESAWTICFTSMGAPDVLYERITTVLDRYGANLYVTCVTEADGQAVYVKYVYINQLSVFDDLHVVKGRFFNGTEKESDVFLSTNSAQEPRRIGSIASFPTNEIFEIRTLKSGLSATLFNQVFVLQPSGPDDAVKIVDEWASQGISTTRLSRPPAVVNDSVMVYAMMAACLVVFALVMFHDILRSNRRIVVARTLGYSTYAIWKEKAFPTLVVLGVCGLCVLLAGSLLFIGNWTPPAWSFLGRFAVTLAIMLALTTVFLSLPFIYIHRIRITEILCRRGNTWPPVIFNTGIKMVATTVLVIYCAMIASQALALMERYTRGSAQWQEAGNYYSVSVESALRDTSASQTGPGSDNTSGDTSGDTSGNTSGNASGIIDNTSGGTPGAPREEMSREELSTYKAIYQHFNLRKALYADFEMYASYYEPQQHEYQYCAVINPNYLNKHTLYDTQGHEVRTVENSPDIFLLVPEKFRASEQAILDYYKPEQPDVRVNITWLRNGQSVFSYRFDIGPDNANCVDDPVLQVLTEANGVGGNYKPVVGYKGSPFKIHANSLDDAQKQIQEQFSRYYDTGAYRFPVTDIYEVAARQMREWQKSILFYSILCGIMLIIILSVLLQNILGYISENRYRVALKHTLGYHLTHKYESYFYLNLIAWGIILAVSLFVHFSPVTLLLCGGLFVIEACCSLIIFSAIQRNKVLRILKGG